MFLNFHFSLLLFYFISFYSEESLGGNVSAKRRLLAIRSYQEAALGSHVSARKPLWCEAIREQTIGSSLVLMQLAKILLYVLTMEIGLIVSGA